MGAGQVAKGKKKLAARAPKLTRGPSSPTLCKLTTPILYAASNYPLEHGDHATHMLLVDPSPRTARVAVGGSSVVGPEWPFFCASVVLWVL